MLHKRRPSTRRKLEINHLPILHVHMLQRTRMTLQETVAYPGILLRGGGSINSVVDRGRRERGSGGGSPLVRISGGGCNLVQKFHFI